MSDEADDETAADSQQESEQQPADTDQSAAQSEEQPADQTDQSTEQSAESDRPADQTGDQAVDGEQTGEQPIDGDQAPAQSEEQPAVSGQPPTSETADNTQGSTGGTASPGGGTLGGPGKPTKVQVIAKLMTNTANDPFKQGAITMNVFDGEKGTLLWKLGSMDQQKVTFQDAALTSNIIKSAMFSGVTANSVKVEPRVKMLAGEHEMDPQIPEVNFGTAVKFEMPATGPLNVDVDVEVTEKEFTVDSANESAAGDAARKMLANKEEIQLSHVKSVTNAGAGKFRVVFSIPTKRILILHPPALEVVY